MKASVEYIHNSCECGFLTDIRRQNSNIHPYILHHHPEMDPIKSVTMCSGRSHRVRMHLNAKRRPMTNSNLNIYYSTENLFVISCS